MRIQLLATVVALLGVGAALGQPQPPLIKPRVPPQVIKLWPGKVPGEKGDVGPERFITKEGDKNPIARLTDVSDPTLTIYRPAKANGTAIVIAPGGGYNILAWEHEGTQVAEWLNRIGVTGVLLKYRVPRRADQPKDKPPVGALQDAQRAISLVRSKAKELGVQPDRIGMLGFSAGGHLTAWASTNYDKRAYEPIDAVDEASARPDFAVLVYSGGVVNKQSPEQMNAEIRVEKGTPPSFLVHAADDPVSPENSLRYFMALRKVGVPAELHIYGSGGHGFGMRKIDHPVAAWTERCQEWMVKQGYLSK